MLSKLIQFVKQFQYHIFLAVCIGLISFVSFNLGKISSQEKKELTINQETITKNQKADIYSAVGRDNNEQDSIEQKPTPKLLDLRVVVSKNSDKYHHTWCPSVGKIKEENRVWFNDDAEAEKAGYILAGNCNK